MWSSTSTIIIVSARPPANFSPTRLKSSRGRSNACPAALMIMRIFSKATFCKGLEKTAEDESLRKERPRRSVIALIKDSDTQIASCD